MGQAGGPADLLRWADERLTDHGIERTGPAEQVRSWNLSGVWRMPTARGRVWLKAVPPSSPTRAPSSSGSARRRRPDWSRHERGRVLMAEVPGEPHHGRQGPELEPMVQLLTGVQERAVGRTGELLALGVPDRRLPVMVPRVEAVVEQHAAGAGHGPGGRR